MSIAEELDAVIGKSGAVSAREMSRSGLTLAKVTNIKDEENLNRVKCLPISAKDEEETDWCYVMAPMGGKDCGAMFFPQVDDLVVLAYLDDDPHRPLVLGAYWSLCPSRTARQRTMCCAHRRKLRFCSTTQTRSRP